MNDQRFLFPYDVSISIKCRDGNWGRRCKESFLKKKWPIVQEAVLLTIHLFKKKSYKILFCNNSISFIAFYDWKDH